MVYKRYLGFPERRHKFVGIYIGYPIKHRRSETRINGLTIFIVIFYTERLCSARTAVVCAASAESYDDLIASVVKRTADLKSGSVCRSAEYSAFGK